MDIIPGFLNFYGINFLYGITTKTLGCRVKTDLDQLLTTADPTAGVEKVPYHFAEGWVLFGAFFIALPSGITKKGLRREQEFHMCEMSCFRLS